MQTLYVQRSKTKRALLVIHSSFKVSFNKGNTLIILFEYIYKRIDDAKLSKKSILV